MDSGLGQLDNTMSQHLTLSSSGISGDGDRERLESNLSSIEGVRDVEVNSDRHSVDIQYDPTIVNEPRLRAAVEEAGYKLSDQGDRGEASQYLGDELNPSEGDDQGTNRTGDNYDAGELQFAPRGSTPGRSG